MSIKNKILSLFKNDKFYYALVALLFAVFLLRLTSGVTERLYERWDEQTNVRVVKEMAQKGGIFPEMTLLGEPFFEKPPLWYWLTYIITSVFGINYLQMRIVSILSGMGIWILLFYALNKYKARWLTITWLVILISINQLFIPNARGVFSSHTLNTADLDALQIFFILGSLISFVKGLEEKKFKWMIVSQVALGLSVLAKGPTGLILYAIQLGYLILKGRKRGFKYWQIILFNEVMWLVALPWYIYMSATYGGAFIAENVGYHVILRGASVLEGHKAHPLYYLELFLNHALNPLAIIAVIIISSKLFNCKQMEIQEKLARIFILFYLGVISILPTKLGWYILPIYIFLSLF